MEREIIYEVKMIKKENGFDINGGLYDTFLQVYSFSRVILFLNLLYISKKEHEERTYQDVNRSIKTYNKILNHGTCS